MNPDIPKRHWHPLPAATAERVSAIITTSQADGIGRAVRDANTILTTPSTLLIGEMTRIRNSDASFQVESFAGNDEISGEYEEYETLCSEPYIIGRFMGCVALSVAGGREVLGCEVSVETKTGGFLFAQVPFYETQIDIEAPVEEALDEQAEEAAAEAEAEENERMLGEAFRYLAKKTEGNADATEALRGLELYTYQEVDFSSAETPPLAMGLHLRAIGIYATELLTMYELVEDELALKALRFILETGELSVGESYAVRGLSSDTYLKEGLLFADNVIEVKLDPVLFKGVKLYSAGFDLMKDGAIHADGTCTPALQFEYMETGEVFDIQFIRVAALDETEDDDEQGDRRHGTWRDRYDTFIHQDEDDGE